MGKWSEPESVRHLYWSRVFKALGTPCTRAISCCASSRLHCHNLLVHLTSKRRPCVIQYEFFNNSKSSPRSELPDLIGQVRRYSAISKPGVKVKNHCRRHHPFFYVSTCQNVGILNYRAILMCDKSLLMISQLQQFSENYPGGLSDDHGILRVLIPWKLLGNSDQ